MKLSRWLCCLLWTWAQVVEAERGHRPPALDVELRSLAGSERVSLCESYPDTVVLLHAIASVP